MSEALAYDIDTEEDEAPAFDLMAAMKSPNLAFDLDASTLSRIGAKVCEEYRIDLDSRKAAGYEERVRHAVELASLCAEKKNTPWENAANIKFPLLIEAAIQFNARSYSAIVDGPNVAKGSAKGKPSPEKDARAERIGKHMSYQLLEEETEWEEDTDELLLRLPIVGTLVRKRYFDPILGRNCSHILGPEEFVVHYKAKRSLERCQRATQVLEFYPNEIAEKVRAGLWLDVELGQSNVDPNDEESPHRFLEQHRLWDLDEDGYKEPYVVTVHEDTQAVVRIMARWRQNGIKQAQDGTVIRIEPYHCFTRYGFIPNPDGSFYDIGYGTLLGSTTDTINTILNQLIDAGTLANLQGGWIGEGVSIKSGNMRFRPGEWKKVGTTGGALRDNVIPLSYGEPSTVLFNLLVFLIEAAKGLTATQDILTGEAGKGTMPVGTVQALVEQGLKTFTAIVKRVHRALRHELGIQYQLNAEYLEPEVYFTFQDEPLQVIREDYMEGDMDVVPVSDPNMATDLQRISQAQLTLGVAKEAGGNVMVAGRRALEAARVPNVDEIFPPQQGPPPPDPRMIAEQAKAELKEREIDIKAATAAADIAKTNVETETAKANLAMMGPEVVAFIENEVRTGIREALAMVENGGQPPVQQGELSGMEAGPGQPPVPAIPGGPEAAVDGGLGQGGLDGLGQPGEGPPASGADDLGMAGSG